MRPLRILGVVSCLLTIARAGAAQDAAWGALGAMQGKQLQVVRSDGAEVRGRLLAVHGDTLVLGGDGRVARVPRGDALTVTHVRKSWWWAWLIGGTMAGAAVSCATTDDFSQCWQYGYNDEDFAQGMAITYGFIGGALAASAVLGHDRLVYSASNVSWSVQPVGADRVALTLHARF